MAIFVPSGGGASNSKITLQAICQPTDNIGTVVYSKGPTVSGDPTVEAIDVDAPSQAPAVGIIIAKSGATSCTVQFSGIYETTGLTEGANYFISTGSTLQIGPPAAPLSGKRLIQLIGTALTTTKLKLRLSYPIFKVP